ncbi:MAG: response regulator transcription factor [Deinococcota bacterium]|nr:response regulator transcription factor [Deinococcota bacterium]
MAAVIRLLIVDDHPIVREGLKGYLGLQPDLAVIGEVGRADEALERAEALAPDLVLLDLQLPDASGLELLGWLRALPAPPRVLVLSSSADEDSVRGALRLGAAGYLVKHSGPGALLEGVRAVMRGEMALDPGLLPLLAQPADDPLKTLTPRELEVLGLISGGLSNKEVAAALGVAEKTVKTHVGNVLDKLGLKGRVQAALYARERKL